jgi:hypothetical protein
MAVAAARKKSKDVTEERDGTVKAESDQSGGAPTSIAMLAAAVLRKKSKDMTEER